MHKKVKQEPEKFRFQHSIVFKIIFMVVIIILPINILTLFMSNYSIHAVEQNLALESENVLKLYTNQLDQLLKRMRLSMYRLATENIDFLTVRDKEPDTVEMKDKLTFSSLALRNALAELIKEYDLAETFYAYFPGKNLFVQQSNGSMNEAVAGFIRQTVAAAGKNIAGLSWVERELDGSRYFIYLSQKGQSYYGAWISLDRILKEWELDKAGPEYVYTFVNANDYEQYQVINGDGYAYQSVLSGETQTCLVQMTHKDRLVSALPVTLRILQAISIVSLLAIPVMVIYLDIFVVRPVKQLVRAMKSIEAGNMEYRVCVNQWMSTEFESMNRNFNAMMDTMEKLKIDVYEKELERQSIKMKYLSQQIQPHFILNTLNILYSYEPEEYPLIQKMILYLSRYFRYIVKMNNEFVQLKQELAHICNYFEIQRVRYPESFYYIVECDEGLENCLIPPLVIQNFAENAIKYALRLGEKIDIYVIVQKLPEGKIRIRIADTGKGMDDRILAEIEQFKKTRVPQPDLGVGIQNAIERLDIFYRGEPEVRIYNAAGSDAAENHGTTVDILLPLIKGEDDEEWLD